MKLVFAGDNMGGFKHTITDTALKALRWKCDQEDGREFDAAGKNVGDGAFCWWKAKINSTTTIEVQRDEFGDLRVIIIRKNHGLDFVERLTVGQGRAAWTAEGSYIGVFVLNLIGRALPIIPRWRTLRDIDWVYAQSLMRPPKGPGRPIDVDAAVAEFDNDNIGRLTNAGKTAKK